MLKKRKLHRNFEAHFTRINWTQDTVHPNHPLLSRLCHTLQKNSWISYSRHSQVKGRILQRILFCPWKLLRLETEQKLWVALRLHFHTDWKHWDVPWKLINPSNKNDNFHSFLQVKIPMPIPPTSRIFIKKNIKEKKIKLNFKLKKWNRRK